MSHHAVAFAMVALALVGAVAASGGEHLGTATATSVQNVSVSSTAQCSAVETARRINCYPQSGASQSGCEARGCCWSPVGTAAAAAATGDPVFVGEPDASTPWCFYPEGCVGVGGVRLPCASDVARVCAVQAHMQAVRLRNA